MARTIACVLFCVLSAAGCHGIDVPRHAKVLASTRSAAEWPAAEGLLSGFEIAEAGTPWRSGDRVLLGIRSYHGDRVTLRYLLVELLDDVDVHTPLQVSMTDATGKRTTHPLAPPTRFTRISVFDESGELLVQSRGTIPDRLLNNGLYGIMGTALTTQPKLDSERQFLGFISLVQFSASSGGNSALSSMTREVIGIPSLWAILTRRPTLGLSTTDVRGSTAQIGGSPHPAAEIALDISFNGELVLKANILATDSLPPLGLVSGVVSVEGQHPTDTTRRLSVRTLAARRGTGSQFSADTRRPSTKPTRGAME